MWGRATSAALRAIADFLSRAGTPTANGRAQPGHAPITSPKSKPAGVPDIDLTARAVCLHNRDRAAANRYLRRHAVLSRGRCSEN